ncbi:chorion class B protein Ld34-like [Helicoverpa zea]|uniref:chorion class B protein Ld34-like n=1 Tax=Helicoverpa zea TaxID=7113 RepID=UPI001F59C939|nr:chorion class B protein Ld34-like [Helicoverpa zea]
MAAKAILVLCAQALLVQTAFSQCAGRFGIDGPGFSPFGYAGSMARGFSGLSYDGLAYPGAGSRFGYDGLYAPAMDFTATSGGALPVTSSSSFAPIGISVMSENMYDGTLNVIGELPFVGTTGVEGTLATAGAGAINHGCGNGLNAMSALSGTSTPASVASAGPAYDGLYTPASTYGANAFAYDRLMAPGFGPATSYNDAFLGGRGLAYDGLNYASAVDGIEFTPTSGGALPVSSASAIPPTGIAVASDNAYEGALTAAGELPFVGTVAMEGVVPSAGAGAVNHACGNGRNAMISETTGFGAAGAYGAGLGAISPAAGFGPSAFGAGFGSGLGLRGGFAGRGCGCRN